VDRAALDVALALGLPVGGWCPKGRRAEDGVIPARYPLVETPEPDYETRTRRNVEDSDGTLILNLGPPDGGTALTAAHARQIGKPCLIVIRKIFIHFKLYLPRANAPCGNWLCHLSHIVKYRQPPTPSGVIASNAGLGKFGLTGGTVTMKMERLMMITRLSFPTSYLLHKCRTFAQAGW
jgi:hypothetical protein